MAHSVAVLPARISPSAKVRIQIAAGVPASRPRLRSPRGVSSSQRLGGAQFRSAAVGAASLIVGALRAIGARVQRVFAVIQKVSVCGSLHVDQSDLGKFADVRKAFGVLRNA